MKSFPAELRKNHPGSALAGDSLFIAFLRRAPDGQLGELLAHCLNLSILGLSPPDAAMLAELGAAPKGFLTWGRNGPDFSAGKGALRLGAFASLAACIPAYARGNLDANTGLRIDIAPYLDDVLRIDDAAAASLMGGFAIHDPSLEELERLPKTQPKAAAANLAIHLLARGLGSCLCATVERVGAAGVLALCERPEAQIPQPFSKQFQDLCAQWSLLAIDKECANLPGRSRPAITRSL